MRPVNVVMNTVCDLLLLPFRGESPWPGMIAAAGVTAVLFLVVFKACSDQLALRRKRGRMISRTLELLLFRHDLVVGLSALPRIAAANVSYLKEMLKPLAVAAVPSLFLLIQLSCWFEFRPFAVGEPVLLSINCAEDNPVMSQEITLSCSDSLDVETDGLRIPGLNQVSWRLRARSDGPAWVELTTDGRSLRKEIVIGRRLLKLSDQRVHAGVWSEFWRPCEPPIPAEFPADQVRVQYPRRALSVAGWEMHWLLAFLVLTMTFGLLFGRWFKVTF